ncbi:MAG: coxG3, partial [Frankiales bacterium]|nr:coxG3 [Frankiales bacterium]
ELTGTVVPIATAPSAGTAGRPSTAALSETEGHEAPRVFAGKAAAQSGVTPDVQTLLLGVGIGGLVTALGVVIGYLLGRRH